MEENESLACKSLQDAAKAVLMGKFIAIHACVKRQTPASQSSDKCKANTMSHHLRKGYQSKRGGKRCQDVEKGNPYTLLVGTRTGVATMENTSGGFRIKRGATDDPAVPLLLYIQRRQSCHTEGYLHPLFIAALGCIIAKTGKQLPGPTQ